MTGGVLFACNGGEEAKGPVIQPKKESTWVKTEKVRTTKEAAVSGKDKSLAPIPVNASLAKQLNQSKPDGMAVTDQVSCLARVESMDLKRTAVQKAGGMWHAFERNADSKAYSSDGMQLDSTTNQMIHGLKHLCRTAEGVPITDLARKISKKVDTYGWDETRRMLLSQGEHPEDIDIMLEYAEAAKNETTRKVDFTAIGELIAHAEPLIDLYEDLSRRSVDAQTIDAFLSDAITLLKVIREFAGHDPLMTLALKEDNQVPYAHPDQDM